MNKIVAAIVLLVGLLIVCAPVFAHHGAAQFDIGKKVTLKGTVNEWFWSNPHCFLRFDVKGADGQSVTWAAETQSGIIMLPLGFTRQTFNVGDEVTVTLEPVKNGRPLGRMLQVVLPSGRTLVTSGSAGGSDPLPRR